MMRQQYHWRSLTLAGFLAFFALTILVQIVRIQTSPDAAVFKAQAENFSGAYRTIYPERGEIYDRNGHLLAGNQTVYAVSVNLDEMSDPYALALAFSTYLGLDYNETLGYLLDPPDGRHNLTFKDFVPAEQAAALQELQRQMAVQAAGTGVPSRLSGLEFQAHLQRSYPENALASNVIGFVSREGRGYFGIEEKYNDLLAGIPTQVWVPEDPNRALEIPKVPDGTTLILTIHRDLQAATEQILDESVALYGAQSGSIIVMDPKSGEILAMAVTPRMDLNQFWNYDSIYNTAAEYNRAVSMPYEPGSVVKILTMAAALDSGTVQPSTSYFDTGVFEIGGIEIQNWDGRPWGTQDMVGCLQHSLNVCLAWISTSMGQERFYGYMEHFGLGRPTGIDLAGEAAGRLKVPGDGDWSESDLGTNAFGQGVTITPIQMIAAASALANDGRMVIPHVLYAMVRNDQQINIPPALGSSPISQQTADMLSEMLAISLEQEASLALLPGYRLAGKTGTGQIPTPGVGYISDQTNASFVGWGPVDDPRFIIYVWLERPSASIWGSDTAAPVFSQVAERTVILLDIPPDSVRQQLANK